MFSDRPRRRIRARCLGLAGVCLALTACTSASDPAALVASPLSMSFVLPLSSTVAGASVGDSTPPPSAVPAGANGTIAAGSDARPAVGPVVSPPGDAAPGLDTPSLATPVAIAARSGGRSSGGVSTSIVAVADVPAGRSFVRLPSGLALVLDASSPDLVPEGIAGQVVVEGTNQVPVTLELDGRAAVLTHPVRVDAPDPRPATATITGRVVPAAAGIRVQLLLPDQQAFIGSETAADGAFVLDVPTAGVGKAGVVAAVGPGAAPAIALARASVQGDTTLDLPVLTLIEPRALSYRLFGRFGLLGGTEEALPPDPFPPPPPGMVHAGAELRLAEMAAAEPWAVAVLSIEGSELPTYDLPGFTLRHGHRYASADRRAWSEVVGPPGALPAPLAPPGAIAAGSLQAGGRLRWEAASGAELYTVRLTDRYVASLPIWEAATLRPEAGVAPGLALLGRPCELRIDAWDGDGLNIYRVASTQTAGLRALRVPAHLPGAVGRHSWVTQPIVP